jgi:Tfp pilus assembly protein PilO
MKIDALKKWFPLIALIIGVVISLFLIKPAYHRVSSLRKELKIEERRTKDKEENLKVLQELESKYGAFEEEIKKVKQLLPEEPQVPELLVQLEALAAENNMIFESVALDKSKNKSEENPEARLREAGMDLEEMDQEAMLMPEGVDFPRASKQELKTLGIKIVVSGTYNDFLSYLQAMENNLRLMNVITINFTVPSASSGQEFDNQEANTESKTDKSLYKFNLYVEAYYR